jgi:alpha-galactosidase
VRRDGAAEVWARPLADGSRAVILLNRGAKDAAVSVAWTELGYPRTLEAKVRDLWQHKDLGAFKGSFQATVEPHGVVMVRIAP